MERILHYKISKEDENKAIASFLEKAGYSGQNIINLKKIPESMLLNGKWEYVTKKLAEGDMLTIHIVEDTSSEKIPPVKLPFPVVYEDEDIVVVNKPADMPIHPSMNNYENTLGNAAAYYFAEKGQPFVFRCINRLDRDTTGLTILAKHMLSSSILNEDMLHRRIKRTYYAIVMGEDLPDEGVIDAPIGRKEGSTIERMVDFENGERAVTHYKVLERKKGKALVALNLETGRTHQIRVHMKYIGHPLIGDFLYNPECKLMERQALHSYRLEFTHPITKEEMVFMAPLPEDMAEGFEKEL